MSQFNVCCKKKLPQQQQQLFTSKLNMFSFGTNSNSTMDLESLSNKYTKGNSNTRQQFIFLLLLLFILISFLIYFLLNLRVSAPIYQQSYDEIFTDFERNRNEFKVAAIADRDVYSYDEKRNLWTSLLLFGTVKYIPRSGSQDESYEVQWDLASQKELTGHLNEKKRGLELSELKKFNKKLYTCDDRSGIIYEINKKFQLIARYIFNDGNGEETAKGFKCEWMTSKISNAKSELYIGSMGKEWNHPTTGAIITRDPMYIKKITYYPNTKSAMLEHLNWQSVYEKVKEAVLTRVKQDTNSEKSIEKGYVLHEGVEFNPWNNRWYFLPRRVSLDTYDEKLDMHQGSNYLVSTNDQFEDIKVVRIDAPIVATRGYSSFKFIPSHPTHIIALKSEELDDNKVQTFVTIFTTEGKVLLPESKITSEKLEGIEFV